MRALGENIKPAIGYSNRQEIFNLEYRFNGISIFMLCKAMRPKEIISTMSVHRDKTREMRSNVAKIIRKGEESLGHGR